MKYQNPRIVVALAGLLMAGSVFASTIYQPSGSNLTYGDVTHGQTLFSAGGNPAAGAAQAAREGSYTLQSGASLSAGLEYGNVDDLFARIDGLAAKYASTPEDPNLPPAGNVPGQLPEPRPPFDIGGIIDENFPELNERVNEIADEVAVNAVLLGLIANEGYGKAYAAADIPVVGGKELFGGNWNLNLSWSGTSKLVGLGRPINFDSDAFLSRLEDIFLNFPTVETHYDMPGDVDITIDPVRGRLGIEIRNDSLVLTKAAKTTELSFGYGREALAGEHGKLYMGLEARYIHMDMSRVAIRFGDLRDSEELFDEIRNATFSSDDNGSFDVGLLWVAKNYQVGGSLININEPYFRFSRGDFSTFKDPVVIKFLEKDRTYTMERQGKLEGAVFDQNRRWSVNLAYDTNAIVDPMGDEFQWASVSAGYATQSWWMPGIRLGYRQNLAGTELKYASIGLTLLKYLNLDVASTFDTVEIQGKKLPQGLMFNLGFGFKF